MNQEPSIAIADTEECVCSCGSKLFKPLISMRKVNASISGTGRDEYVPTQAIVCDSCNKLFERPRIIT